jgi:predicted dithiol-disulfide oxidoreductase (DUF899 family)
LEKNERRAEMATAVTGKATGSESKSGAHAVVSHEEWVAARKDLLAQEKNFLRLREELARARRQLPWERVEKEYVFEGREGKVSLADLFGGRSQLIVYHFMLAPGWKEGCPGCSFLGDHFDGAIPHVQQRDITFVAISRAPLAEIEEFKKRMGWNFKWVSSNGTDFNFDYGVSFREEDRAKGEEYYNYAVRPMKAEEMPGASVFAKNTGGEVFHTYSTYARGLDMMIGAYQWIDLSPKGRDEDGLKQTMAWVKHHDKYEQGASSVKKESCCGEAGH